MIIAAFEEFKLGAILTRYFTMNGSDPIEAPFVALEEVTMDDYLNYNQDMESLPRIYVKDYLQKNNYKYFYRISVD